MDYDVTIGIPVYNAEKYIRMTIDSVLAQTFGRMELLVVDDCGTDHSIDIVREYQQQHPRGKDIRIVSQPQNGGIGRARNRIIDEARGRYVYFMDADDTIEPNTIELLYANAVRHSAQIVYGSYERVEQHEGQTKRTAIQYVPMQFSREDEFANYVYRQYEGIQAMVWNCLIDIDVCRKNDLRFQPVNYWEDFSFTLNLPTYITRAVLLPDITYHYYIRKGSVSNQSEQSHIGKEEIQKTIDAINQNKAKSARLLTKPYLGRWLHKLLTTDFYIACTIFRKEQLIAPSFTKREIRDMMRSPLNMRQTLALRQMRWQNTCLYLLGVLPPALSVAIMKACAKMRKLM